MTPLARALLIGTALLWVGTAHAFTVQTYSTTAPDGSARFVDPDTQQQRHFAESSPQSGPMTLFQRGGTGLSFGLDGQANMGDALRRTLPFGGAGWNGSSWTNTGGPVRPY